VVLVLSFNCPSFTSKILVKVGYCNLFYSMFLDLVGLKVVLVGCVTFNKIIV